MSERERLFGTEELRRPQIALWNQLRRKLTAATSSKC
jgi:hypothetical protein